MHKFTKWLENKKFKILIKFIHRPAALPDFLGPRGTLQGQQGGSHLGIHRYLVVVILIIIIKLIIKKIGIHRYIVVVVLIIKIKLIIKIIIIIIIIKIILILLPLPLLTLIIIIYCFISSDCTFFFIWRILWKFQ